MDETEHFSALGRKKNSDRIFFLALGRKNRKNILGFTKFLIFFREIAVIWPKEHKLKAIMV